jgi:hypothetical protein
MTGRCAWRWWTARGATRPRSQLPRRRLQLAMVRAGAPSSTTPLPTPNPPPATLLVAPAPARLPAVHRFAGWAGGLMAQRGAARRAVWRLFKLCKHLECHPHRARAGRARGARAWAVARGEARAVWRRLCRELVRRVVVQRVWSEACGRPALLLYTTARTRLFGTFLGSLDKIYNTHCTSLSERDDVDDIESQLCVISRSAG